MVTKLNTDTGKDDAELLQVYSIVFFNIFHHNIVITSDQDFLWPFSTISAKHLIYLSFYVAFSLAFDRLF